VSNILRAFNGDVAAKQAAIDCLTRHWINGRALPAMPLRFSETNGLCSVMGSTIESNDEAAYVRRLGIPAESARLHEILLMHCGRMRPPTGPDTLPRFEVAPFACDYPLQWLQAIRPGADLAGLAPRFVAWLLHDLQCDPAAWPLDAVTRALGQELSVLFDAFVAGKPMPVMRWGGVRRAAVKATDAAGDAFTRAAATFFESIAWPPEGSRCELPGHVMGLWFAIREALENKHMSAEERARREALHGVFAQAQAQSQESGLDMFEVIASKPEWQAMLEAMDSPEGRQRSDQAHMAALPAILPIARRHFEALLTLTAECR
jgi:hypothetical protein